MHLSDAESWMGEHGCSGILTQYPLDTGAYDWALDKGYFKPKKPEHYESPFIETFTDASQPHIHYENGKRA